MVVPTVLLCVHVSPPSGRCFASFVPAALALRGVRDAEVWSVWRVRFGRSRGSFILGGFVVLSRAIVFWMLVGWEYVHCCWVPVVTKGL